MRIITRKTLTEYGRQQASARKPLEGWFKVAEAADWGSLQDVRNTFPTADLVGRLTVFNVGGNHFRLITRITYQNRTIYIRAVLTHAEYDKGDWKNDDWF